MNFAKTMLTAKLVPTTLLFLLRCKVSDAKLEAGGQSQFSSSVQLAVKGLTWDVLWTKTLRIKLLHFMVKIIGKSVCCKMVIQTAYELKIYRPVDRAVNFTVMIS